MSDNDGGWIEAVKTSQASSDSVFADVVSAVQAHVWRRRVRARLKVEGEPHTRVTSCHR